MTIYKVTEFYNGKHLNINCIVKDEWGFNRPIDEIIIKTLSKTGKTVECLLRKNNINYMTKNYRTSYIGGSMFIKIDGNNYLVGKYEEV